MKPDQLLAQIQSARTALSAAIARVAPEERNLPGLGGGWSVKDNLVHLNFWEGQLVTLLFQLRSGAPPSTVHFSGRTLEEINAGWYAQGKDRVWEMAWADFNGLGGQITRRVSAFSEKELNDPRFHPKLRAIPLCEWIITNSCAHEDEHRAAIEAWLQQP